MRTRTTTAAALAVLALALTACSSSENPGTVNSPASNASTSQSPAGGHHYTNAQDIADALKAAGFTVSKLKKDTSETYISKVGGTAYDFTVTDHGRAPGSAGINMFPNSDALAAWVPLSKSFGGVAVTGDTWAVSLPTDGSARADSKQLAPKIAKALGGTVQQ